MLTPIQVRVQSAPFDVQTEIDALCHAAPTVGAVCAFLGRVREFSSDDTVLALDIEHYPGMTEAALQHMAAVAVARFGLAGVRVVHRIGYLAAGETIVLVVVSAVHRSASFQACEFLMDDLKTQAPFWKKEITAAGARWVEAHSSDAAAWRRWQS